MVEQLTISLLFTGIFKKRLAMARIGSPTKTGRTRGRTSFLAAVLVVAETSIRKAIGFLPIAKRGKGVGGETEDDSNGKLVLKWIRLLMLIIRLSIGIPLVLGAILVYQRLKKPMKKGRSLVWESLRLESF